MLVKMNNSRNKQTILFPIQFLKIKKNLLLLSNLKQSLSMLNQCQTLSINFTKIFDFNFN